MWKNYSVDYIKNNRASGISIIAASFIAGLFLSFLCCLFYNFWLDNIEGIKLEDGDWHGRITGEIDADKLAKVNYYANVEKTVVREDLSGDGETVVDVYFYDKRTAYQDMSALVKILELPREAADYNYQLLSLYFIRIPGDGQPRLLMPMYFLILIMMCFSLILVIHNAFGVSMNSRMHQFGIFASIGATPGQIRKCLVQEAFFLALGPILLGILAGAACSFGTVLGMGAFAEELAGGRRMAFQCHPAILILVFLLSAFTILISALIPAGRLSHMTPLEAIRGTGERELRKRNKRLMLRKRPGLSRGHEIGCFPSVAAFGGLSGSLFGIEGELAWKGLKAQRKALRTTSLSLTIAFLGYMVMQCFWTLSGISTNHTYFEAYQDAWDVMATVKDTPLEDFSLMEEIRGICGAENTVFYQKAEAVCALPKKAQSVELQALGGLGTFLEDVAQEGEDFFLIKAPVVILDDDSFREFCGQTGIAPQLNGTIVLNRLWDSQNSNFRYPRYIPYVENMETVTLYPAAGNGNIPSERITEIPVLACTQMYPALREEYEKSEYPLVQFMPLSLWKEIGGKIGGVEDNLYIRILAQERGELAPLQSLENELTQTISPAYEMESENRLQEKIDNDKMIEGYEMILGAFCGLLAVIGVAHVFSHTLGFLGQRKREFARLMSVGLTPEGIRKIFRIEAMTVAGRPMLRALLLTIIVMAVMIRASYLDPVEFIVAAPVWQILGFVLTVFGFVALAYYLGGKKILKMNLAQALRDDTMM